MNNDREIREGGLFGFFLLYLLFIGRGRCNCICLLRPMIALPLVNPPPAPLPSFEEDSGRTDVCTAPLEGRRGTVGLL